MKISLNRGTFNGYTGLVCLCHLKVGDEEKINRVVLELSKQRNLTKEKVIIVPYSRLDKPDDNMSHTGAEKVLEKVASNLPNTLFLPYIKHAPFHLSVPGDSLISFLEI